MDEASFMQSIAASPHDTELVQSFASWLIDCGDKRGDYLQLELERRATETKLRELESNLRNLAILALFDGTDPSWLDKVFPLYVLSPTVGTFYGAETPDSSPFVSVGDYCNADTIVGIIEALMVFNQIPAGKTGVISEVLVRTGDRVEYGQPLFRMDRPPRLVAGG